MNENRNYECKHCNLRFASIKEYIAHMDTHEDLMVSKPPVKRGWFGFKKKEQVAERKSMSERMTSSPLPASVAQTDVIIGLSQRVTRLEERLGHVHNVLDDLIVTIKLNQLDKVRESKVEEPTVEGVPISMVPDPKPVEEAKPVKLQGIFVPDDVWAKMVQHHKDMDDFINAMIK